MFRTLFASRLVHSDHAIAIYQKCFQASEVMPCCTQAACKGPVNETGHCTAFERVETKTTEAGFFFFAEKFWFSPFIVGFLLNCRASMPRKRHRATLVLQIKLFLCSHDVAKLCRRPDPRQVHAKHFSFAPAKYH